MTIYLRIRSTRPTTPTPPARPASRSSKTCSWPATPIACGSSAPRSRGGSCRGNSSWCGSPDSTIRCLARPLALYEVVLDAAGEPSAIDVVYLVLGKMTTPAG